MVRLAISYGDPCGIGPEVVNEALRTMGRRSFAAILVGDAAQLPARAPRLAGDLWPRLAPGDVVAIEASALPPGDRRPGRPTVAAGHAQLAAIDRALEAVLDGHADAVVTAPVSKAAIHDARPDLGFRGHTEYLAQRSGVQEVAMMFHGPRLRVALVTTHLPLRDVPGAISGRRIEHVGRLLHDALRDTFGIARPRIGVCGLNPHAGEGGLLGREELDVIAPAVKRLSRRGRFSGPLSADAAFRLNASGALDGVVALYHDQATIAVKLADFGRSVNVTLGLPFCRTSVDHGVGYDIAGKGVADASSMRAALRLAAEIG